MTEQTGVSLRRLAQLLAVDRRTIRRHRDSGVLAGALNPDGTFDLDRARTILERTMTRGPLAAPAIREARVKRARAKVALLADQVQTMRNRYLPTPDLRAIIEADTQRTVTMLREWPAEVAPAVAGLHAADARPVLKASVLRLLTALCSDPEPSGAHGAPEGLPDLDSMSPQGVDVTRLELEAEMDRWKLAIKRGEAQAVEPAAVAYEQRCSVVKSLLLGLPGQPAMSFADLDVEGAKGKLGREVEHCVACLSE